MICPVQAVLLGLFLKSQLGLLSYFRWHWACKKLLITLAPVFLLGLDFSSLGPVSCLVISLSLWGSLSWETQSSARHWKVNFPPHTIQHSHLQSPDPKIAATLSPLQVRALSQAWSTAHRQGGWPLSDIQGIIESHLWISFTQEF